MFQFLLLGVVAIIVIALAVKPLFGAYFYIVAQSRAKQRAKIQSRALESRAILNCARAKFAVAIVGTDMYDVADAYNCLVSQAMLSIYRLQSTAGMPSDISRVYVRFDAPYESVTAVFEDNHASIFFHNDYCEIHDI